MAYETLEYEEDEGEMVTTIRFDRPEKKNALSTQLLNELEAALEESADNDRIRAIVLTGNGDAWSAGVDLMDESRSGAGDEDDEDVVPSADEIVDSAEEFRGVVETIWNLNKPVIAAVNGYCLAGATDVAMICDIVIAAEEAEFGYPGHRVAGHSPTMTFPFFMGIHQAKELLLTGKVVDAEHAERLGVYNRVVPQEDLMDEVYAEVDEIKKVPGNGVRIQKHSLNAVAENMGMGNIFRMSPYLNALAHVTDLGKEYYQVSADADHLSDKLEWMNEVDKGMRTVRDDGE